jgi:hypothetical protein
MIPFSSPAISELADDAGAYIRQIQKWQDSHPGPSKTNVKCEIEEV